MPRTAALIRALPRIALFAGSALLAGCAVGPNFHPARWAAPSSWFSRTPKPAPGVTSMPVVAPVNVAWWGLFGDPILTKLEDQVAKSNLDVALATERLVESRAELGVTGAGRYPVFNAQGSYQRFKSSNVGQLAPIGQLAAGGSGGYAQVAGGPKTPVHFQPFDVFQDGFDAVWEPDIWGQVARQMEAARAQVQASAEARRGVLLIALAEVARDYIDLRGSQALLRIARENLRTARQSLQLTRDQAAAGVTTDLDVANAAAQVASTAAEIPALRAREHQEMNALALLLGRPPGALAAMLAVPRPVPPVPPQVPVGFPSQLAERRPDIREAEAKLHAATANVGVAVAAFYPSFTLSASFGFQALQFHNLWSLNARQYDMGPSFTIPIFQGGQLEYTLHLRKAQQREAAINFEKTALTAWHEVANALISYRAEQQRRAELVRAVAQNRKALALSQSRYKEGVADFLTVLVAERSLLASQQQLATSTTTVSTDLVALYKALGGGWQTSYPVRSRSGPVSPVAQRTASAH